MIPESKEMRVNSETHYVSQDFIFVLFLFLCCSHFIVLKISTFCFMDKKMDCQQVGVMSNILERLRPKDMYTCMYYLVTTMSKRQPTVFIKSEYFRLTIPNTAIKVSLNLCLFILNFM